MKDYELIEEYTCKWAETEIDGVKYDGIATVKFYKGTIPYEEILVVDELSEP